MLSTECEGEAGEAFTEGDEEVPSTTGMTKPWQKAGCLFAVLGVNAMMAGVNYGGVQRGRPMNAARLRGLALSFDCQAGLDHWQRGWSLLKQEWCCTYYQLGCGAVDGVGLDSGEPFDCDVGTANWDLGASEPKKEWCCQNKDIGCPSGSEVTLTWVVSEVNFEALKETHLILANLLSVAQVTITEAAHGYSLQNIDMRYWAGSGLHASTPDAANTGVVMRAKISLETPEEADALREEVDSRGFQLKLQGATRSVGGIRAVCFGTPGVEDLTVEEDALRSCTCEGGTPEIGMKCAQDGGERCKFCDPGYHMMSTHVCLRNVCSCEGGVPSEGDLCKNHMTTSCASCYPGYHYNRTEDACRPNSCTCPMGYAASGDKCTMHLGSICDSCYPGFHVDPETLQCKPSICACPNGTPVDAKECPFGGVVKCKACAEGYHVNSRGECEENTCICTRGTPALGSLCTEDGKEVCAFCDAGVFLHDGLCGDRVCLCPHGDPAVGAACTSHKGTRCASCDIGYDLDPSGICVAQHCGCENGKALPDSACSATRKSICESCFDGYRLVDGRCESNQCTCQNGHASVGPHCAEHGAESCANCDAGYHHIMQSLPRADGGPSEMALACVRNVCTCSESSTKILGQAATTATTPVCHSNGENICVSCIPGYHLDGTQCVANECKCDGGVPVASEFCAENGATSCHSCYADHSLEAAPSNGSSILNPLADGIKVCKPDVASSPRPFDCSAGFPDNWEQAWSEQKKSWCCREERKGCVGTVTGVEACEGRDFDAQQCGMVGCCMYDVGRHQCLSRIGEEACAPVFAIKAANQQCLSLARETALSDLIATMMPCNRDDMTQFWKPTTDHQIKDAQGRCLEATSMQAGAAVHAVPCAASQEASQIFTFSGGMFKVGVEGHLCLSTPSAEFQPVTLAACDGSVQDIQWSLQALN